MKEQRLNLPEWAFLDADNHTGNQLKGRDVLLHVRTHTILEFLNIENDSIHLNPDVKQKAFTHKNGFGVSEKQVVAVHYSLAELEMLDDVIDKAIDFYCKWIYWMDGNIESQNTTQNN